MIEKIKIELWDIFVYLITGVIVLINILLFSWKGIIDFIHSIDFQYVIKLNSFFTTIFFLFSIFSMGLIIEPLANLYEKLFKKFCFFKGLETWRNSIENNYAGIKEFIPLENKKFHYQYCKTYLIQNNIKTEFMAFLSKFGLYRNISFLCFVNGIIILFIKKFDLTSIFISILLIIFSQFYLYRSQKYYCHMTNSILTNFLIFKTKEKNNKQIIT
ncbi:MAG: hypothetical protein JXQ65_03485 [Candidatus Marinimicrobia bacterium]|nr:hypothetical protein [Candidatus Neomarinimicrobiota bacterium]